MTIPGCVSFEARTFQRRALAVALLLSSLLAGGCTSYAVLQARPENDRGASTGWVCPAATEGSDGTLTGDCVPDGEVDESRWNQSGTTRYLLPACPNGIRRIRLGGGQILVECAAPSGRSPDIGLPSTAGGDSMPPPASGPSTTPGGL